MPINGKVICCSLWRETGEKRKGRCKVWVRPLEGEPGVAQALCCSGSLLRDQLQHGQQEIREALCLFTWPLVFIHQHFQQTPRLQLRDVFQITFLGEKVLGIFSSQYEFAWDCPQQLNDQCYVVFIPRVIFPRSWFKQIISCGKFKGHAGCAPNICWRAISSPNKHLQ